MTEKSLFAYRGTAGLYFILGLALLFADTIAAAAVFFMLGLALMVRTHDQVDYLAQNRPILVWIPFFGILVISVFVIVLELVMPLV